MGRTTEPEPCAGLFTLTPDGVPEDRRREALACFEEHTRAQQATFLGYQANEHLDYTGDLAWLLDFHVNNVGDPFVRGNFRLNSKLVEREVLDYYARLWHAKVPHDPADAESYWGYVLTMGSTEGNIMALWNARDYLAGRALMVDPAADDGGVPRLTWVQAKAPPDNPNAYDPIIFYSEDTHYSFTKAARVLNFKTFYEVGSRDYPDDCPLSPGGPWPTEVPSVGGVLGNGDIDVDKLAVLVEFFAAKGHPIMVSLNYGSTFKCAYDDVERVTERLLPIFLRYGLVDRQVEYDREKRRYDVRHGFWIHVDGALGAAYMPFLADAGLPERVPPFDFRLPYVFSLVMSGHKWVGAPWPCGVFMTKVKYQLRPPDDPEYIGAQDSTFAGSRNGFSPLILWSYLARHSYGEQTRLALEAQQLAGQVRDGLAAVGRKIGLDLWVDRSPLALTVRFRRPAQKYVDKYSLSLETLPVGPQQNRELAHVYLMPGIDRGLIAQFLDDLTQQDAYPRQVTELTEWAPGPVAAGAASPDGQVTRLAEVPATGRGFR
ncbi:pyridoxal-dependent decarboxylase [Micromonospora sp. Rc5]|uniref:pyridoxal-dependent decarboxylase n=1 Tax=Micromonospora sp. Rc5 TaxID=1920666 RepID=UPI0013041200|nr:pyridoxal-dependent decarboxylase [Micromonospora sp. Rc5]